MIVWAKVGGILAAILIVFGAGFYFGGLRSKTALEALQAAQSSDVAKAVLAERASAAAESVRLNGIIATYEKAALTPLDPGVAHRLYVYAAASQCAVSKAGSDSDRAIPAGTVAGTPRPVEQALDAYIAACDRDAKRLNALIQAWPK